MSLGLGLRSGVLGTLTALFVMVGAAQAHAAPLTWNTEAQLQPKHHLTALDCPTKGRCTALANTGTKTYEYTFAPSHPTVSTSRPVDNTQSTGQLSCPTSSLCVFGDGNGTVTAFDPLTPTVVPRTWPAFSTPAYAVSCPTAAECIVLSGVDEATFNPAHLGLTTATGQVGVSAQSVACPSASQCTAVGSGGAVSFNPLQVPQLGSTVAANPIDNGTELVAISCPTARQCDAVDRNSHVVNFNPESIGAPAAQVTGAAPIGQFAGTHVPIAISCASSTDCVEVADRETAFEGNPQTAEWTAESVKYSDGLTAVSCPALGVCLSGDNLSFVFAGTLPSTRVLPEAGRASVGSDITTATGVKVILRCAGTKARCSFRLSLAGGAGPAATETVTLVPGTRTVTLNMTALARKLLQKDGQLGAEFIVRQTLPGLPSILLAKRRVIVYAA